MNNKQIEPIIKATRKALSVPDKIEPPKKEKMKRAKPLKYDTGEKNWNKQINDILAGNMDTKTNKLHEERREKKDERDA